MVYLEAEYGCSVEYKRVVRLGRADYRWLETV